MRKLHLFLSCDGNLYDTRVQDWANHPLRTTYMVTQRFIETTADLKATLRNGHFADGGYPLYFIAADGEPMSFKAVQDNLRLCLAAIHEGDVRSGWRIVGCDVNWEDNELVCAHTGEKIPSAYGED